MVFATTDDEVIDRIIGRCFSEKPYVKVRGIVREMVAEVSIVAISMGIVGCLEQKIACNHEVAAVARGVGHIELDALFAKDTLCSGMVLPGSTSFHKTETNTEGERGD